MRGDDRRVYTTGRGGSRPGAATRGAGAPKGQIEQGTRAGKRGRSPPEMVRAIRREAGDADAEANGEGGQKTWRRRQLPPGRLRRTPRCRTGDRPALPAVRRPPAAVYGLGRPGGGTADGRVHRDVPLYRGGRRFRRRGR